MAYSTRTDIETKYGRDNVAKWADLDNISDQAAITAAITAAIAWSDAQINGRLRDGPYAVPLVGGDPIITEVSVQLSAYKLASSRGTSDFTDVDEPLHRLSGEKREAMKTLREINAGMIVLDKTVETAQTSIPFAIEVKTSIDDE